MVPQVAGWCDHTHASITPPFPIRSPAVKLQEIMLRNGCVPTTFHTTPTPPPPPPPPARPREMPTDGRMVPEVAGVMRVSQSVSLFSSLSLSLPVGLSATSGHSIGPCYTCFNEACLQSADKAHWPMSNFFMVAASHPAF